MLSGSCAEAVSQSLYYDVFSTTDIATAGLTSGDTLIGLVQGLQREKDEEIGPTARIAVVTGISLNEYFIKSNG